ncbi:MAG TPA: peptidyl-alpha-hydroxyglycine alpha-amidating lyase family protein, partial [Longimicrobiales bacterium]|nr:peptidyl-alpha-hydroxyglycine alpha-amidating lyase family protein [Longimicrobiales bacterium]
MAQQRIGARDLLRARQRIPAGNIPVANVAEDGCTLYSMLSPEQRNPTEVPVSSNAIRSTLSLLACTMATLAAAHTLSAQVPTNPFRPDYEWGVLPEGRQWGSTSAIYPASDGNIWVAERCGQNTCVGSDVDPVLLMDPDGNVLRSFGAGQISWPHGMFVDRQGNVWITDASTNGAEEAGLGHTVMKFSPTGELLLTIGEPGQAGDPPRRLTRPNDVVVAPSGEIFIVDGHGPAGPNRLMKYAADGTYIRTIGDTGYGPGEFLEPHAIAMDSQGRLFIADRYNNRIQLMSQEGEFLASWTQFGRPSGIFIDEHDIIYVADSESGPAANQFTGQRNAGWERGIRIGDARDGWVFHFIPET